MFKVDDRMAEPGEPFCSASDSDYICTRPQNHEGEHVAHGFYGYALHIWPQTEEVTN